MPPETPAGKAAKPAKAKSCPICGKPATPDSHPFCSERCRDVDLNRWLSGSYAIPAAPADDDED
ncbi:DNA gyrase inhibitor [Rhodopseudomonas sp. AAP120]|uniref:DNA gyrase inhibitor YacG n=1 Tax=Rhodopseudomonas sp. AAP120 TaxID=1523430 RepID=UPI0006B8BD7B|nr:DNA gyrase inhibitor YacG [Rhodopseudomonas sp. AAP120]KPG02225.1 DNA gyrase inhibitor [Rhodopseudomonas sp. AAP120]